MMAVTLAQNMFQRFIRRYPKVSLSLNFKIYKQKDLSPKPATLNILWGLTLARQKNFWGIPARPLALISIKNYQICCENPILAFLVKPLCRKVFMS